MRTVHTPVASLSLLLTPLPVVLVVLLGTHLNEAASVNGDGVEAAVDKEVASVGVVKADLLSLEQEISGNPSEGQGARPKRSFLFGVGGGPAWIGAWSWVYPGYGYYSSPYYGYAGYAGYYLGVFGYKKIIIG